MYITTNNGNLVPLQNIKAVKNNGKGTSTIVLKTGERISDDRPPEAVLQNLYQGSVEVMPILEAMVALNKKMTEFEAKFNSSMSELVNKINVSADTTAEATKDLKAAAVLARRTSDTTREAQNTAKDLIGVLNDAIQEVQST